MHFFTEVFICQSFSQSGILDVNNPALKKVELPEFIDIPKISVSQHTWTWYSYTKSGLLIIPSAGRSSCFTSSGS